MISRFNPDSTVLLWQKIVEPVTTTRTDTIYGVEPYTHLYVTSLALFSQLQKKI